MSQLVVGVDVAKDSFVAAVWAAGRGKVLETLPNAEEGFQQLATQLQGRRQEEGAEGIHLTLEATGGYELRLAYFAHAQGWQVSVVNPKPVRDWAKGLGRRAKTDRLDALVLAQYGAERRPHLWRPLPEAVSQLESLVSRKRELEEMLRQEANRQHSRQQQLGVAPAVPESMTAVRTALQEAIQRIESAIDELLRRYPPMQEKAKALGRVPGIGPKTVLPILVLLQRWDNLTQGRGSGKGLTAYVGLDPKTRESGKTIRDRAVISRMGNPQLRRTLYLAALGGVRGDNALRLFYRRLVGRGKPKMVALVAAAHKILLWAWLVYHGNVTFDNQRSLAATSA